MRILQVSSACNPGGGETHVRSLVEALRARGHEVLVAGRHKSLLGPAIELPFMNSADFLTAFRLRSSLKKESFDIVHAHVARDYTVVAAAALGIPNLKVVFTRHLLYPVRAHRLYRRVDAWIAPTSQILKTLEPLSPKICAVIPNWVDVEKIEYRPHPLHNPVAIGILGQISPHKGHDDAIEAMRELGEGFRLFVAGTGKSKYVDGLKKKSAGLQVEFLGFVSLRDFFEAVDVLAVPSWKEPFGIVLLEANAAGIPVVATGQGGPLDIIPTALDGVLVPHRNHHALAEAIRLLAADHERRSNITRHARARVEENFDIRQVVPRVEDLYRRVMVTARSSAHAQS
jgi:glycosyltransferase involved in cell wall biosynthesis